MKRTLAGIVAGLMIVGIVESARPAAAESTSVPAGGGSDAEVQTLRERTATYWAARMAGDDKVQWELLEPRGRGRLTPREYGAGRTGVRYLGYQVEDATIAGYFATVKVRLLFQPILPRLTNVPAQTVLMDDRWVKVGGVWYRQFEDRQPPKGER